MMSNVFKRYEIGDYSIVVIPILNDNFSYLIVKGDKAILLDPGDADPILDYLKRYKIELLQILITHSHSDHTGGCLKLQSELGVLSRSPGVEEEDINILNTICTVMSTPGHTVIHKSFYFPELEVIFTGDALINGACGRLLGGTAEQLFDSLKKISSLPSSVKVFGGHDYLEDNLKFALNEDPSCESIVDRLNVYHKNAADGLFVSIKDEILTNPFMQTNSVDEFAQLRKRKDCF